MEPRRPPAAAHRCRGADPAARRAASSGARAPEDGALGGIISKQSVLAMLSQDDAEYLRYYHARDATGRHTIVLVAADAQGNDLVDGAGAQMLDHHFPCPPYCPTVASNFTFPNASERFGIVNG